MFITLYCGLKNHTKVDIELIDNQTVSKFRVKTSNLLRAIFMVLMVFAYSNMFAQDHNTHANPENHGEKTVEHKKGFDFGGMIMHHVSDAHEINFIVTPSGKHYSIFLPIILKTESGYKIFSSGKFYNNPKTANIHGHETEYFEHDGYAMVHEKIYKIENDHIVVTNAEGTETNRAADFSLTKSIVGLLLAGLIICLLFISIARKYKKNTLSAPKGLQSFLEPLVVFVRDQIAIPNIGAKKAYHFMPFLLTMFFLILISNLLGLIPFLGGFNVMGTLGVTIVLAGIVFIITTVSGKKHYWGHLLNPPGVPFLIKLILVPIELVGIFLKPIVLMIRLTANITAGHIILMAFVGLIFMFGQDSAVAGYGVGIGATLFMVFMFCIELLVAFLQAYVFTMLSAMYFGAAVQEVEHH